MTAHSLPAHADIADDNDEHDGHAQACKEATAQHACEQPGALDAGAVSGPLGGLLASVASTLEPPMPASRGGSHALAQRVAPRVVSLPSLPTQPVNSQSGHLVDEGLGTLSTLMGMGNAHGGSALTQPVLCVA